MNLLQNVRNFSFLSVTKRPITSQETGHEHPIISVFIGHKTTDDFGIYRSQNDTQSL